MTSRRNAATRFCAGASALTLLGSLSAVSAADAAPLAAKGKESRSGTWVTPKEKDMKLEVCAPYLGGEKALVGYYHGIKTVAGTMDITAEIPTLNVPFNKVKAGTSVELEFSLIDSTNNCVIPEELFLTVVSEINCSTKEVIDFSYPSAMFEDRERHHQSIWEVPVGKGRCYQVFTLTLNDGEEDVSPYIAARFTTK
ncbi:unannotated protein [freshwater metagenome]|uniref:Unannotated protein n=1 Tax=freshwater metagenome TaxID=449393 RepID=A0A6J7Q2Q1_9ZZZZ